MTNRRVAMLIAFAAVAVLAACGGGGGGSALPAHQTSPLTGSMSYTLNVPSKASQLRAHAKHSLQPLFESPATRGLSISIALAPSTPQPASSPNAAFNLDPALCTTANGCTANADGSRTYTITTPLVSVGTYNVLIATWDATPAPSGTPFALRAPAVAKTPTPASELSDATAVVNITGTNTNIGVTLNGVPATVAAVPLDGQSHVITDTNGGYDIIGNVATQWSIAALDAHGYIIAGDGAPLMTFSDATNSFKEANLNAPSNLYAITATAAQPSAVSLGITATGLGPSAAVSGQATVNIVPMQELWQTQSGAGLFGFRLDSSNSYEPPSVCCTTYLYADQYTSTDDYRSVAQDSSGALWVYDATTNKIVQFVQSSVAQPAPSGTTISVTSGHTIASLAGDVNGFLYGIDSTTNSLLVWQVVGASSSTPTFTVSIPNPMALGVSILPNFSGLPAGLPGSVLIADSAGLDFYTNASAGSPTHIATGANPYDGVTGLVGAAVSPDASTVWTVDSNYEMAYSSFKSPNSFTLLASGDPADDLGNIATGIGGYAYASQGADPGSTLDAVYANSGSVYGGFSLQPTSNDSYGVCLSP